MALAQYQQAIENEFLIIDKTGTEVPFKLKKAQADFLANAENKNTILKARQLGFTSMILGVFAIDFLFQPNQRCVVISHETDATARLMDRVKYYISTFERKNNIKLPLKYNSRNEMVNSETNSSFYVGTAGSKSFGRGDTLTNLLLSEFAFYSDAENLLAGVMQAVVPTGKVFIETTANGFNFFKGFWNDCEEGERPFKPHFYNYKWDPDYDAAFIAAKKKELKRLFKQEYPATPQEAFLTSGETFFDSQALQDYMTQAKDPLTTMEGVIYV